MASSNGLAKNDTPATSLNTSAEVEFTPGTGITGIKLTVRGEVPGLDNEKFVELAEAAKAGCPVSQALSGTTITLDAALA
jgi:osmotically inducible protein OsmC